MNDLSAPTSWSLRRLVPVARLLAVAATIAASAVALTPVLASADANADVRGDWTTVARVGGATYPQTLHFTYEDLVTGVVRGQDLSPIYAPFTLTGKVTGNTVVTDVVGLGGSYRSHSVQTVGGSGSLRTLTGTFHDSNGVTGSFASTFVPGSFAGGGSQQPSYAAQLRSPTEISWKPIDVLRSAVLAGGLIVIIGFPGQLFNSTLMSNYAEVMGWFAFLNRFRRRKPEPPVAVPAAAEPVTPAAATQPSFGAPMWQVIGIFLLSAFIGGFLDPNFGQDFSSIQTMLGILLATVITTFVYTGTHAVLMHRLYGVWGHWQIFPGGIAVVLICVVISKVTSAEPGYIYGVMLSYSLGSFKVPEKHEGRLVAAGYLVVLVASLGAWLLWSPVKVAATAPTAALPVVLLSSALAGIFIGGMCSMVFGLIPLRFLDGEKLLSWQRLLWVAMFGAGMFLFVHVVLNNTSQSAHPGRSYVVAITFFAIFGVISVAFWAYFRFRTKPFRAPVPV